MIKERLINCPRPQCGSNACAEISNDKLTIWHCFGCGFTSNSTMVTENLSQTEEVMPELYKALRFKDDKRYYWYPSMVSLDDKSMLFAEGVSAYSWKWSAVQAKDGKPDMTTKKEFPEREYMDALEFIGYFNQFK